MVRVHYQPPNFLRSRPTAGRWPLKSDILVQIQTPQPDIWWRSSEAEQTIDNRPAASSNLAATTTKNGSQEKSESGNACSHLLTPALLLGSVAQMKRAAGFYPAGRGFKSYQTRQFDKARIAKSGQRRRPAKPKIVSSNLTACSTLFNQNCNAMGVF